MVHLLWNWGLTREFTFWFCTPADVLIWHRLKMLRIPFEFYTLRRLHNNFVRLTFIRWEQLVHHHSFRPSNQHPLSLGQTEWQVIASWKLTVTCYSVWPRPAWTLRRLAMTCVHFDRSQILTQVNPKQGNARWRQYCFPLYGSVCKGATKLLSRYLRWTCVFLRVRMATHRKFVFASSHFLTCVDLRLRLARALPWYLCLPHGFFYQYNLRLPVAVSSRHFGLWLAGTPRHFVFLIFF